MAEPPENRVATPPSVHGGRSGSNTSGSVDARVMDAWCAWLGALATDAEAVLAAAIAYEGLDGAARDKWISALEQDAQRISVPRIAVYAPLLAVESDPERTSRILDAMGPGDEAASPRAGLRGLRGRTNKGQCVATIISPLYLDFVQVLACGYTQSGGFDWVKHEPIIEVKKSPQAGQCLDGVELETTPLKSLVDELAHAVLAHVRSGRELPDALRVFADLFGPQADDELASRP